MSKKNILISINNYAMNLKSYNTYKTTLKETAEQNFIEIQAGYITSKNISAVDFLESFLLVSLGKVGDYR